MKRIRLLFSLFLFIGLVSCNFMGDPSELTKLNEKIIRGRNIELHWYQTSSVTSQNDHISITRNDSTREIARSNLRTVDSIYIRDNSIVLVTNGFGLFYHLDRSIYGYSVVLDTVR